MQDPEVSRIQASLKIIYKSSDLLLHLLNDLITFSRNSFGQQLAIEEHPFRLVDIGTQLLSLFQKQVRSLPTLCIMSSSSPTNRDTIS